MFVNIPAVCFSIQKQPNHRQKSTYLVFYDIEKRVCYSVQQQSSVVLKEQGVKWFRNFVLCAMTLRLPPIIVAYVTQSVSALL